MGKQKSPQILAKFIAYILERRPDEFGLVTDSHGYIKIKDLLKALNEEEGFKHVRRSHLDEILYSITPPPFEILDNRIRAKQRDRLPRPELARDLPKLLYTSIRRKAHPFIVDRGIFPSASHQVVLSSDRSLAERMGKRSDPDPVILTVQVQKSIENGVQFYQTGDSLFLAASIPPSCFSGPAVPREKPESPKQAQTRKNPQSPAAGSFLVDFNKVSEQQTFGGKSKNKEMERKDQKRRMKKQKLKRERPPWRR